MELSEVLAALNFTEKVCASLVILLSMFDSVPCTER